MIFGDTKIKSFIVTIFVPIGARWLECLRALAIRAGLAGLSKFGTTGCNDTKVSNRAAVEVSPRIVATVHPWGILRIPDRDDEDREYQAFVADLQSARAAARG